jgi:hypothetical protein
VQEHSQLVQAASQELAEEKSLNAQQQAEIKTALAELRTAEANFKRLVAESMSKIILKSVQVKEDVVDGRVELADSRENTASELGQIDGILAGFMQQVDQVMGVIEQKGQQTDMRLNRKVSGGQTRREGGRLTANVQFDDGSEESISAVREEEGLRIVPDSEG